MNKIREYETQLQLDLCRAKANFKQNLLQFNSNNASKIFDYSHSLAGQCGLPAHVHYKSTTAESDQDKAQLFNHSIFTTSSFPLPNLTELPKIYPCLSTITQEEVYQILVCLQPAGGDGIGPKLLKSCALSLYEVFHHLFSLSLSQSCIPLEWRVHTMKPIHKSGDRTSVENYRPISLLARPQRSLQKSYLNISWSLCDNQNFPISIWFHAPLIHPTAVTPLCIFYSLQVDVIYLDFKKAL